MLCEISFTPSHIPGTTAIHLAPHTIYTHRCDCYTTCAHPSAAGSEPSTHAEPTASPARSSPARTAGDATASHARSAPAPPCAAPAARAPRTARASRPCAASPGPPVPPDRQGHCACFIPHQPSLLFSTHTHTHRETHTLSRRSPIM